MDGFRAQSRIDRKHWISLPLHGRLRAFVILCPPGPSYLTALFGTFCAGLVAVTAYPPRANRRDFRLDCVISDSSASIALVDSTIMRRRDQILRATPSLAELVWIDVEDLSYPTTSQWTAPELSADSLAMLQYTSGSTSEPKGVCLTHGNLMANLRMIYRSFEVNPEEDAWSVSWLPPYHDMGLIGGLLQVMYAGTCSHVMPPASFVQKPIRWLRAIDKYRASISGGPNFAYDTCLQRIAESELDSLDLSTWTLAYTGSEPIRYDSLVRFAKKFSRCGFEIDSFFPCYGLAEATLMVSGGPRRRVLPIQSNLKQSEGLAEVVGSSLVSCGRVAEGQRVRIVHPDTGLPLPSGQVGEIWVRGENVSPGYWENPAETQRIFDGRLEDDSGSFLKTGDLGFLSDGELFVSGRMKELIVIRGRNFQPAELEATASHCSTLLIGNAAAAFEAVDDVGEVGLVIVAETEVNCSTVEATELKRMIRQALVDTYELEPLQIVLIPKRSLPKTSSGKVRRLETKRRFLKGKLPEHPAVVGQSVAQSFQGDATIRQPLESCLPSTENRSETRPDPFRIGSKSTGQAPSVSRSFDDIHRWLSERLSRQLGLPADQIDPSRPFVQYGLDSVSAVQITGELESFLGRSIPATLFYEAPNILAVAQSLQSDATSGGDLLNSPSDAPREPRPEEARRQVAIIGMDCRLPECVGVSAFWELLRRGGVAVGEPPDQRNRYRHGDAIARRAGWIEDPDLFDATFFGISPREAKCMDPQHRLLLETCWRAIEAAGIDPKRLAGSRTGAFVGIANRDYERLILLNGGERSTYAMTGNAASMAAHRLSFHLDLHGPSLAIDTACSSSLVALHQAVRAIQAGDCDASLVAGVNLILGPDVFETLSISEMLSPDGLCKTFDAAANGYVRGEGCVAMLLKPLDRALTDGDPICAVILGTAINQDGQTNGITAPNGESQARLYRDALADARLPAASVTRIEAHGTGTPLGDPIEVRSLCEVYGGEDSDSSHAAMPCRVGAVKANVGHTEAAAGLTSLLKVVLELQHHGSRTSAQFVTAESSH